MAVQKALSATNSWNVVDNQPLKITENQCAYVIPSSTLNSVLDWANIAGTIQASITSGVGRSTKFTIMDSTLNHEMINFSTNIINVRAYFCQTRRDILTQEVLGVQGNTSGMLYAGFGDASTAASASAVTATDVASTLFNNPRFTIYNKILKVHKFQMMPGEQRNFGIKHKSARQIRTEFIQPGEYEELKGTKFWVFQVWGGIVASATLAGIATATSEVAFITNRRYNYTWQQDLFVQTNTNVTLAAIGAGNEKDVNPDTDTVITNAVV